MMASDNVVPLTRRRRGPIWPLLSVSLGLLVSIGVLLVSFRLGALMLAATMMAAVLLRLLLPERSAGLLAVRTRAVDVAVLGTLTGLLTVLAVIVPQPV